MLQCFDHIILRLADGDILRDQASHLIPTQDDFLTLVRFLLAHNSRYYFRCEFAFREELPHTNGLIVGRGVHWFRSISSTTARWLSSSK